MSGKFPIQFSYQDNHEQAYILLWSQVWKYVTDGGEIKVLNQPTGAENWIVQAELENEIMQHADFSFDDKKLLIPETNEEDAYEGDNRVWDRRSDEGEDDDQLVLNIEDM